MSVTFTNHFEASVDNQIKLKEFMQHVVDTVRID